MLPALERYGAAPDVHSSIQMSGRARGCFGALVSFRGLGLGQSALGLLTEPAFVLNLEAIRAPR